MAGSWTNTSISKDDSLIDASAAMLYLRFGDGVTEVLPKYLSVEGGNLLPLNFYPFIVLQNP